MLRVVGEEEKCSYPRDAIYLTDEKLSEILKPHEYPLVIEIDIGPNSNVTKVMSDNGSSVYVLYSEGYK